MSVCLYKWKVCKLLHYAFQILPSMVEIILDMIFKGKLSFVIVKQFRFSSNEVLTIHTRILLLNYEDVGVGLQRFKSQDL